MINEEDWPIIDDYNPVVGGGSSSSEFTGP